MKKFTLVVLLLLALYPQMSVFAQLPSIRSNKISTVNDRMNMAKVSTVKEEVTQVRNDSYISMPYDTLTKLMDKEKNHDINFIKEKNQVKIPLKENEKNLVIFNTYLKKEILVHDVDSIYNEVDSDTLTLFYYNYHKKNKEKLIDDIKAFEDEADSLDKPSNLGQLKILETRIVNKRKYLKAYETLYFSKINAPRFHLLFPSSYKIDKEAFFKFLYDKNAENDYYFVNNASLQLNGEGSTIQSEITSAFLGAFRVSFGTLVTNSKEETETAEEPVPEPAVESATEDTEAFQRLLTGGGNAYLNLEYPLLFKGGKRLTVYLNAYTKGAVEISEFSDDVDTSTGNGSFGGSLYSCISTDNAEFNFFLNANYGLYMGSDAYYDRLQVLNHKSFGFGQVTVGVTILDRLRLSFTTNTFSSESQLRSGKILFGVQILSGLFEAK